MNLIDFISSITTEQNKLINTFTFYFLVFFRFDHTVTLLLPYIFCSYYIKNITNYNCIFISALLSKAIARQKNTKIKLKLQFKGQLNSTRRRIMTNNTENITSLNLQVLGSESFLLNQDLIFRNLESLSIGLLGTTSTILEELITKHASTLKKLSVGNDDIKAISITVPVIPNLYSLVIKGESSATAWSLIRAGRQTITRLFIRYTEMNVPANFNVNVHSLGALFNIPCLQHLTIRGRSLINSQFPGSTNFLVYNANNLTSLSLFYVKIPLDIPEFPNLQNLNLADYDTSLLHILTKCKTSLESLVINIYYCGYHGNRTIDSYALEMPKLTKLYLCYAKDYNKMLSMNQQSLEFVYLYGAKPLERLDGNVQMKRVRTVVLKSLHRGGLHDLTYTAKDREASLKIFLSLVQ
jgi:hypothetical protein